MTPSGSQPYLVPVEVLYFLYISTTSWTIYQFALMVMKQFKRATLHCEITPGTFWRLSELGERVFVNCVIFSDNGPCKIQDIRVFLTRAEDGKSFKSYQLSLDNVGTVKPVDGKPLGEFHFHSSSAMHFLPPDQEERPVYLCKLVEHVSRLDDCIVKFREDVEDFKITMLGYGPYDEWPDEIRESSNIDYARIVQGTVDEVMRCVQLEPGRFRLTVELTYSGKRGLRWSTEKKVQAHRTVEVDSHFLGKATSFVREWIGQEGANILSGEEDRLKYPEYSFVDTDQVVALPRLST